MRRIPRSRSCAMERDANDVLVAVCNFTPVVRYGYRIGVPGCR